MNVYNTARKLLDADYAPDRIEDIIADMQEKADRDVMPLPPPAALPVFFAEPEPTAVPQWLVVLKPKMRYITQLPAYEVVVEAADKHAARYAAKNEHPQVFNTLDTRYHDIDVRMLTINKLFKLEP